MLPIAACVRKKIVNHWMNALGTSGHRGESQAAQRLSAMQSTAPYASVNKTVTLLALLALGQKGQEAEARVTLNMQTQAAVPPVVQASSRVRVMPASV